MKKMPSDPLRVRCLELVERLSDHNLLLRDYALTPGNTWLAKGELGHISQLVSELESLLEEIKQADSGIA